MGNIGGGFLAAFTALITLAVVAVILSQRAQTSQVLAALGGAAAQSIGAATAPVTATAQATG